MNIERNITTNNRRTKINQDERSRNGLPKVEQENSVKLQKGQKNLLKQSMLQDARFGRKEQQPDAIQEVEVADERFQKQLCLLLLQEQDLTMALYYYVIVEDGNTTFSILILYDNFRIRILFCSSSHTHSQSLKSLHSKTSLSITYYYKL